MECSASPPRYARCFLIFHVSFAPLSQGRPGIRKAAYLLFVLPRLFGCPFKVFQQFLHLDKSANLPERTNGGSYQLTGLYSSSTPFRLNSARSLYPPSSKIRLCVALGANAGRSATGSLGFSYALVSFGFMPQPRLGAAPPRAFLEPEEEEEGSRGAERRERNADYGSIGSHSDLTGTFTWSILS